MQGSSKLGVLAVINTGPKHWQGGAPSPPARWWRGWGEAGRKGQVQSLELKRLSQKGAQTQGEK